MVPNIIKYDHSKHAALSAVLPFSYYSAPPHLDCYAYLSSEKEPVLQWEDPASSSGYCDIFPSINPAQWENRRISQTTEEDCQKIQASNISILKKNLIETEYFYKNSQFLKPKSSITKQIRKFQKDFPCTIKNEYEISLVGKFYDHWANQKNREQNLKQNDNFFFFCLRNVQQHPIKQLYIEINGSLVGLAMAISHRQNGWVSLYLKALYEYPGLSHFLRHEMAKNFPQAETVALGPDCGDAGIKKYKEALDPKETKQYFSIQTGTK